MYKNGPVQNINPNALATFSGHTAAVNALITLPDGRIASGSDDQSIRLWNVRTGACEARLSGHESAVVALTLMPDGRLVSGSNEAKKNGTIKLWNVSTGSCESTLGKPYPVQALAALPDGRLACAYDHYIGIWNLSSSRCEVKLEPEPKPTGVPGTFPLRVKVQSLASLPDGRLACGSDDSLIRLWGENSGYLFGSNWSCQMTLSGHTSFVMALTTLPNGYLASGSGKYSDYGRSDITEFCEIKIWNLSRGICVSTLKKEHSSPVRALMSLSNDRLVSNGSDQLDIWNMRTGVCESELKSARLPLTVLPNDQLASGYVSGLGIKLWDMSLGYALAQESVLTEIRSHISKLSNTPRNVRYEALKALENMARNKANQEAIADAGGIAPLVRLLGDTDTDVRQEAAAAVCHLAQNVANKKAIVNAGGIAPLVRLLEDIDAVVRKNVAGALANLALNNTENQEIIVEANAVPLLEQLSQAEHNVYTKRYVKLVLDACQRAMEKQRQAPQAGIKARQQTKAPAIPAVNFDVGLKKASVSAQVHSDPFAEFDAIFSTSTPSTATNQVSTDWTMSDFATVAAPLPPNKGGRLAGQQQAEAKLAKLDAKMQGLSLKSPVDASPSSVPTITYSSLQIDTNKRLGQGGFGVVYKGTWQMVSVAIKQLHATRLSAEALKAFQEEAQCHGLLRHPNTVMLFGVCVEPGRYGMVMEFMAGGSLYDLLHSSKDMPWSLRVSIAHNISVGLYYLHEHNIIHRDLKSLNVLLDEHNQAKLADFGLSTVKSETQTTTTVTTTTPGTIRWMAPELFKRGAKCTTASDIYALGWIFWELSSRKIPFQDEVQATNELIKDWVKDGEREAIPISTPPRFAHLLTQCWAQRAEERPSTAKAVAEAIPSADAEPNVSSGYAYYSRA